MEASIENMELKTQNNNTEAKQSFSVEEVFDRIDDKFIRFYGEYGRKIVNNRRSEWNQEGIVNLKML